MNNWWKKGKWLANRTFKVCKEKQLKKKKEIECFDKNEEDKPMSLYLGQTDKKLGNKEMSVVLNSLK